jgi:hypothetical protein
LRIRRALSRFLALLAEQRYQLVFLFLPDLAVAPSMPITPATSKVPIPERTVSMVSPHWKNGNTLHPGLFGFQFNLADLLLTKSRWRTNYSRNSISFFLKEQHVSETFVCDFSFDRPLRQSGSQNRQ